jgi:hypothetical protein
VPAAHLATVAQPTQPSSTTPPLRVCFPVAELPPAGRRAPRRWSGWAEKIRTPPTPLVFPSTPRRLFPSLPRSPFSSFLVRTPASPESPHHRGQEPPHVSRTCPEGPACPTTPPTPTNVSSTPPHRRDRHHILPPAAADPRVDSVALRY